MTAPQQFDPRRFPSRGNRYVVGLATAPIMTPENAVDLFGRVEVGSELPQDVAQALDPLFVAAVETANSEYFRFDLDRLEVPTVVDVPLGGRSLPGLDADQSTRKLTLFLPLGSRSGTLGRVRLPLLNKEGVLDAGTMVMFPSYISNVVEPTERLVGIIAFAVGPAFR